MKSPKKEEREIVIPVEDLSPIAHPLAQKKLLKKLQKTIKKGELSCHGLRFKYFITLNSLESPSGQARSERSCEGHPQGGARVRQSKFLTRRRDGVSLTEAHEQTIGSRCGHHTN